VEQLEGRLGETPPRRDSVPSEVSSVEAELTQLPAKRTARLRPLLALAPYVARYRRTCVSSLDRADHCRDYDPAGAGRGAAV